MKSPIKLPPCEKCKGIMFAEREPNGVVGWVVVVKCVLCGNRMSPDQIEALVASVKTTGRTNKPAIKKETGMAKKKVRECAECEQMKKISARELCGACWQRLNKAGTLDAKHPAKSKKVKTITPASPPATVPVTTQPIMPVFVETVVTVDFKDRDIRRFHEIVKAADYNRRSLSEEVLFRLDRADEAIESGGLNG